MAFSFPPSPSLNDTFSVGARSWIWNGYAWDLLGQKVFTAGPNPPNAIKAGDQWYNTNNDILYEFISDGSTQFWLDISTNLLSTGPAITSPTNVVTDNTLNPLLLAGM